MSPDTTSSPAPPTPTLRAGEGRILESGHRPRRFSVRAFGVGILDLYIAGIFLKAYGACLFAFCGVYVMVEAISKLERFLKLDQPLWSALADYFVAMVPTIYVNYLGPILTTSASVAVAVTLHRSNELVPINMTGRSARRSLAPAFVLAAAAAFVTVVLQEEVIPQLRGPIRRAIGLTRQGAVRPDKFYDEIANQHVVVREYSPSRQVGRGIEIVRSFPDGRPREQIDANEITWEPAPAAAPGLERGRWILHNGSLQRWNERGDLIVNPNATDLARLREPFQKMVLEGGMLPIDLETSDQDINYLASHELQVQLQRQPSKRHLAVKLHQHRAFPFAHIFLPAIAIPLVLASGTRSTLLAVIAGAVLCTAFFLVNFFCMSAAGNVARFDPFLAAWLPVLLFGTIGITCMVNLRT